MAKPRRTGARARRSGNAPLSQVYGAGKSPTGPQQGQPSVDSTGSGHMDVEPKVTKAGRKRVGSGTPGAVTTAGKAGRRERRARKRSGSKPAPKASSGLTAVPDPANPGGKRAPDIMPIIKEHYDLHSKMGKAKARSEAGDAGAASSLKAMQARHSDLSAAIGRHPQYGTAIHPTANPDAPYHLGMGKKAQSEAYTAEKSYLAGLAEKKAGEAKRAADHAKLPPALIGKISVSPSGKPPAKPTGRFSAPVASSGSSAPKHSQQAKPDYDVHGNPILGGEAVDTHTVEGRKKLIATSDTPIKVKEPKQEGSELQETQRQVAAVTRRGSEAQKAKYATQADLSQGPARRRAAEDMATRDVGKQAAQDVAEVEDRVNRNLNSSQFK